MLNLEELSGLYVIMGDCGKSISAIERAHGEDAPVYGFLPVNGFRVLLIKA